MSETGRSGRGSFGEAACVTAVVDGSVAAVLRGFGVEDGADPVSADVAEDDLAGLLVGAVAVPGGVAAVEWNGFEGSRRPVLRAVSQHGRAASAFWNVNMVTRASFAEHGQMLRVYEDGGPVGGVDPPAGGFFATLDLSVGDPVEAMLGAVERFTGLAIDQAYFAAADFYPITPLLDDAVQTATSSQPRDEKWLRAAAARLRDPELPHLLVSVSSARQRGYAIWAATRALTEAGLADDEVIGSFLQSLTNHSPQPLPAPLQIKIRKLDAAWHRAEQCLNRSEIEVGWRRQARELALQCHALQALIAAATVPAPDDAAIDAARSASAAFACATLLAVMDDDNPFFRPDTPDRWTPISHAFFDG